ncbi:hypothetical protein I3843_09G082100 [Carya illinoinensis]|nr:hypothetical protein I3843_09G082100 [Carya illinoinensis]
MASCKFSLCLVCLISIIITLLSLTIEAAPTYASHDCQNATFFTPSSTYQANLNFLLSSLSSNSTLPEGFYRVNTGKNPPDAIIGRFLCRGDLTPDLCQNCISTAIEDVRKRCPCTNMDFVVITFYEYCSLGQVYQNTNGSLETVVLHIRSRHVKNNNKIFTQNIDFWC